jgi:hypothetical protein
LVFLLLPLKGPSLASQDLKIENNSAPLLLAMLGVENSIDPDDVRDELKFKLVLLNGALKDLNKNWDFSDIIRKLSSDPGPVLAINPKLRKQIERVTKLRNDFLRTEQEKQLWPVSCIQCRNIRRLIQQEQLAFRLHYICRRAAARTMLELAPLSPRKSTHLGVH